MAGFSLSVSQNEYMSTEDNEMHAVLTVTAAGLAELLPGGAPEAAEVIAIDCSGSMDYPQTKIAAARRATAAAIDALRDGVFFAVIAGTHFARVVYPLEHRLVAASPETKRAAKDAVKRLVANGGTAMGTWLRLANTVLDERPAAVRHVIMLTDGKNETETRQALDAVLADCEGKLVCDARGIGEDWMPAELLRIVSTLHGSADAVREDADLVADFTAMTQAAMAKVVPDLRLRIRTMPFARLRFVKQTFPTEADLTEFGTPVDGRTTQFSTGSWGEESREYHVCLDVDRADLDMHEDIQAARVDLAIGDEAHGTPQAIRVHWTDDLKLSSVLDPKVAHFTGQTELGKAVVAGCEAHDVGNMDLAAAEWGRAVALAAGLGNDKVLTRLGRLVDIVGDPADGVVRIKGDLSPRDILSAAMSSVMSTRSPESVARESTPPAGPDHHCPQCSQILPADAVFCSRCGNRLGETA
jgi:Ca-activated chloride channel family protein